MTPIGGILDGRIKAAREFIENALSRFDRLRQSQRVYFVGFRIT